MLVAGIILAFAILLQVYLVTILKPPSQSQLEAERRKYFENMKWFEMDEWEIFDSYYSIESFRELKKINRTIEKIIKKSENEEKEKRKV